MKKHLLWLPIVLVIIAAFTTKTVINTNKVKPVDKQVQLTIYSKNDYTASVYDEALASINVTVTKVKGSSRIVVWQKTFNAIPLKSYPTIGNAFTQQVNIPNVMDTKEKLEVTYSITYDSKGSVLKFVNGEILPKGVTKDNLMIHI